MRKPPADISLIALMVENTNSVVLYQGERIHAPDVTTLLGGKIGDETNTALQNRQEQLQPQKAAARELNEEARYKINPDTLIDAFSLRYPYMQGRYRTAHLFVKHIKKDEIPALQTASGALGRFVQVDLDTLQSNPLANNPYISPLNLELLCLLNTKGITGETYDTNKHFVSLPLFQKRVSLHRKGYHLMQRGLQAA